MNKENTEKIMKDFPEYFKHVDNIQASLMAFGFECGDGWFDLIYGLCENIKPHYDELPQSAKNNFWVTQVKEKYGGLRFYTTHLINDEVISMIDEAEEVSYKTCETCGNPGTLRTTDPEGKVGWLKTLCSECAEKQEYHLIQPPILEDNE